MKNLFVFLFSLISSILLFSCKQDLTEESKILSDTTGWYNVEIVEKGWPDDEGMSCNIPKIKFEDTTGIAQLLEINWKSYWGSPGCFVKGIPDSLKNVGKRLKVKLRKINKEETNTIKCVLSFDLSPGPFGVITEIKEE
jgi:hypothetical protein